MNAELEVMDDIVGEARADWIDLGHAIGVVARVEGEQDDLALFRRAATLITRLVRDERLVPGDVGTSPGSFIPWSSTPDDSARFLEDYVEQVVAGAERFEPWQPCMFAAADGE